MRINKTRQEWKIKDYNLDQKRDGKSKLEEFKKAWSTLIPNLEHVYHTDERDKKFIYKPSNLDFIENSAREAFHGPSLESRLHLGIYQYRHAKKEQIRTKYDGKLPLTSQDHIYPDSRINDKANSYHPENMREGSAVFNNLIKDKIDPIVDNNNHKFTKATVDMLNKYNFKKAETEHVPFKWIGDKIISSNMINKELFKEMKGSYEAPELRILEGPKSEVSLDAYSIFLYKINSKAGILDITFHDNNLKEVYSKIASDITSITNSIDISGESHDFNKGGDDSIGS